MDPWTIERTETELDEAWRSFHSTDLEFRKGLSNHGPMAAEALVALGHPQRVAEFVARYRARLEPLPSGAPIPAPARHAAVGDLSRRADWIATYHAMIDEEGPQRVARREIPALASGVMAGALHALIRTGHALRALHRRDTPTRRCELAHALGYWAARHQPLPGRLGVRPRPGQDLLASLAAVPTVPTKGGRLIFERVEAVRSSTAFIEAVETADLSATTLDATVTAMVDASAELYLSSPRGRFVYLHGITGSSALRLIAPWLDTDGRRVLLHHTIHALLALHATHGDGGRPGHAPHDPSPFDPVDAAARAASSGEDHTIKLVEALLRERAHAPRRVLESVARHRLRA